MCSFFTSLAITETLTEPEWYEFILSWLKALPVMKIVWICLGVVGVIFILPAAIKSHRKTLAAWQAAANELGLEGNSKKKLITGEVDSVEGKNPIECKIHTYTVHHGKSSTTYTKFEAKFSQPFDLDLKIYTEGSFRKFTKLFGAQDIHVLDEEFDKTFIVKGIGDNEMRYALTPERRAALLNAHQLLPGFKVGDDNVNYTKMGVIRKTEKLVSNMRVLIDIARDMS